MQVEDLPVVPPLRRIELARLERAAVGGIVQARLALAAADPPELAHEFEPALAHGLAELPAMVGEEMKRRRCAVLLPLEEHRRLRTQQEQRGHRTEPPRARLLLQALAERGVGDLV